MGKKIDKQMQEHLAEVLYDAGARVMSWEGVKLHSPDEYDDYMSFAATLLKDKRIKIEKGKK